MARQLIPGEAAGKRRWGLQDETQNHNRIYAAQIIDVDYANGVLTAVTTGGQKVRCMIPIQGASRAGANSAWMRFMPDVNDHVIIGFGPDNQPYCLGMTLWGHDPELEPAFRQAGYAQLAALSREDQPPAGLREFVELKPGEFDLRSSGGSYIHGSRTGVLTLSGGLGSRLSIDKTRDELTMRMGMLEYAEGGTKFRLGDIKRNLGTAKDSVVTPAGKAAELDVGQELTAGAVVSSYSGRWGDVRNALGVVEVGPIGPTRILEQAIGAGNVPTYTYRVDSTGNVAMTATNGRWTADTTTIALNGSVSSTLNGGQVFLGQEGNVVNPLILSTPYRAGENAWFTALNAAFTTIGAAGTAAVAAVSAAPTPINNAAAISALGSALAAALIQVQVALAAFNGASATYLSTRVYTQ